jgi:hypothetical protein
LTIQHFLKCKYYKKIFRNHIQYLLKKLKNNTNVPINEILSNLFTSISFTKFFKILKIELEHSHLIVEKPSVTQTYLFIYLFILILKNFDWAFYDNNISELLKV